MYAGDIWDAPVEGGSILVVQDDFHRAVLTAETLADQGYSVLHAHTAEAALECIRAETPDLVLADIVLPDMDGIELCRRLKNDPATRLIPVVLIAGQAPPEMRLRAVEAGADVLTHSMMDGPELLARLKSLIRMRRSTLELENAETVLVTLALGVEGRDPYTRGHCRRLARNAAQLGLRLNLSRPEVTALRRGGVLHDIGKITIPDAILTKRGALTQAEVRVMQRHPEAGERICRPLQTLARVLPIIRHHHEHWNGAGYPDGLEGRQIPLLARVLQVVDAYDALTSQRPYKAAWGHARAKKALLAEAEKGWWDREILQEYLALVEENQALRTAWRRAG